MTRKKIIPKRIGTVKIPKNLRKFGDRVLTDPQAREMAGKALLAVDTALAARGARKSSILRDIFDNPAESARAGRDTAQEGAAKAGQAASGVADAVTQVVGEVIDTIRRDFARKIRPVRPRHAHDEHDEPAPEDLGDADDKRAAGPRGEGDDRMH
jgi:hypothetical protein